MSLRFNDVERVLTLSVRDLVEICGGGGNLVMPSLKARKSRLEQGREVHQLWQDAQVEQDDSYAPEVNLKTEIAMGRWTVEVQGRLDGLIQEADRWVIEEVKSVTLTGEGLYRSELSDFQGYELQLKVYLWMFAKARGPASGRLILVSVLDGAQRVLSVQADEGDLETRIRAALRRILDARDDRIDWMSRRKDESIPWPFPTTRPGQQAIREHVATGLSEGRLVMVEAPTGLGKTAPILVEALREARETGRQVFWATARTTQQQVVKETIRAIQRALSGLRVVTITAKSKACLASEVRCDPTICAFASLHHAKVEADGLLQTAWNAGLADGAQFRAWGQASEVCPYQLAADTARNADLVIGDYNYVFDPERGGSHLLGESLERWIVVIDEAHQLIERARNYASPQLSLAQVHAAASELGDAPELELFSRLVDDVAHALDDALLHPASEWRGGQAELAIAAAPWRALATQFDELAADFTVMTTRHEGVSLDGAYAELVRAVYRFVDGIDRAGPESVTLGRRGEHRSIRLYCLDPSGLTGPVLQRLGGAVLASATLSPFNWIQDLLGISTEPATLSLPSPFPAENCRTLLAPRYSTLYRDREAQMSEIAALIASLFAATEGNLAVFCSSFAVIDSLVACKRISSDAVLVQQPDMTDSERAAMLAGLTKSDEPKALFAVSGGIFAEGIDLPSGSLSAAVIIGPALPPVGLEQSLLADFYEERYGSGFQYASVIPGMIKVIQAAGRVVRRANDRGVVVLVGKRFRWREYADLFPSHWSVDVPDDPIAAVRCFFSGYPSSESSIE